MLVQILRQIAASGASVATRELPQTLGVSRELVEQMIEQLVRLGYLVAMGEGCGGPCHRCSRAAACAVPPSARLWVLTERGRRLTGAATPEAILRQ